MRSDIEDSMRFVRHPLNDFESFRYVPWDEVFQDFRGATSEDEALRLANMIITTGACDILDLGVGRGEELLAVIKALEAMGHSDKRFVGIDIDVGGLKSAAQTLSESTAPVSVQRACWQDLSSESHAYRGRFDFAFLTGNCLTHSWLGNETRTAAFLRELARGFRSTLKPGGWLFIDARNFDFILSLEGHTAASRSDIFRSMPNVCYHGLGNVRFAFPAYISSNLVVFHYYDTDSKVWSANDFFPITHRLMLEALDGLFEIVSITWDYSNSYNGRSHFTQYLTRSPQ
jgi:hypothetical protein